MQLNLSQLLPIIENMPSFKGLIGKLKEHSEELTAALILESAKPYLIAAIYRQLRQPLLVITSHPENAKKLYEQISFWCISTELDIFSEPDTLPYQRAITDVSIGHERLKVLFSLSNCNETKSCPLIITSVSGIMHKIMPKSAFLSSCHVIQTGMDIDPLELINRWESLGYQRDKMVEIPGTMSRRGDIIDIFPPSSEHPVRIEFFGNTIESIRLYEPSTQRSQQVVPRISICPGTEVLPWQNTDKQRMLHKYLDLAQCSRETKEQITQELAMLSNGQRIPNISFFAPLYNSSNLLEYLPQNALVIVDEPSQLRSEFEYLEKKAEETRKQRLEAGELPANYPKPYFIQEDINSNLLTKQQLTLLSWANSDNPELVKLDFVPAPSYAGQLPMLISKSKDLMKRGNRLIVISNQASRLSELFQEEHIYSHLSAEVEQLPPPGTLTILQGAIAEGWATNNTYLLTDKEIFGFVKERRLLKRRQSSHYKILADIKPGDYVVHIEHGIGVFSGVINKKNDTTQKEYLILTYAEGDKLYVPTDQIDRINKYVGAGESNPTLNRLGTQEWNRIKQKVKASVTEIAQDLLTLYSKREVISRQAYSPDTVWQKEMEASFPYIETPDQIKVQEDVKDDMAKPKPMDRLIIGDVGYGKTEIAIRAAFKAVMDNKQVAVLVPTTVLAEQHYLTFKQRMVAFPLTIEVLSRFRNHKEQNTVIEGLSNGSIDICIGTHRLLQKDIVFKNLGLLIIDEEQRFGVSHKEYLKKLREEVDVLTLSATPIPRTLHMSLVGARDMSVIETPPENRLPIRTYVAEYNDQLVKDAILRELERDGQVFYVHNRVQGIANIAGKLMSLVPEAVISVAHGQMPEEELEKVMFDFQKGESNVLVCTTIIESGLDLPNANTLIVNQADRFGLTQLYQLRGRIGRGSNLAYAYFLYEKDVRLTGTAEKRLKTIFEAKDLGAGFGIAMKDLEIRGAGTLLGTRQSGNITAIGFNLYTQLLAQAVEDQKSLLCGVKKGPESVRRPEPAIDLPLKSYISDIYISDIDVRLSVYQKLAGLRTLEQVEDLAKELNDRFGPPPQETQNLLYAVRLKTLGTKMGIETISTNCNIVTIRLLPNLQFSHKKLARFNKYGVNIGLTQIIIDLKRLDGKWQSFLQDVIEAAI